jgi:hypothetical protein
MSVPSASYLMAFHTCANGASDCSNPTAHEVRLAESADGTTWSELSGWTRYQGSVPDLHRRESTLYISGGGVTRINMNSGEVTPDSLVVLSADGSNARARDFAFAGENAAGLMVGVYVPSMDAEGAGTAESPQYVSLATEVEGSDGNCFEFTRHLLEITDGSFGLGGPSDPDLFFDGTNYVLYTSFGANVFRYTSSAMDGTFANKTQLSANQGGVPTGLALGDGSILSFVNQGVTQAGTKIHVANHSSSATSVSFSTVALHYSGLSGSPQSAESPGVILNAP